MSMMNELNYDVMNVPAKMVDNPVMMLEAITRAFTLAEPADRLTTHTWKIQGYRNTEVGVYSPESHAATYIMTFTERGAIIIREMTKSCETEEHELTYPEMLCLDFILSWLGGSDE